jgi:uncharacterized membrane protein
MKRLMLGLTDAERRQMQQNRSARRCMLLLTLCIVVVGMIEKFS